MDDLRWVELEGEWHLVETTFISEEQGLPSVTTRCGITALWNQTFVDRLPGGLEWDGPVHDECRAIAVGGTTEEAPPAKTAKTAKSK